MTKKIFIACMAAMMMAGCAKEVAPETNPAGNDAQHLAVKAGEQIEVTVTLPEIDVITTRASLAENGAGGFTPTWSENDQISIGGEVFTLVSFQGKTAKFSGTMPEGNTFDILYPAGADNTEMPAQKADKDYSHLRYRARLIKVNSIDDITFGYGWAAEHGGTFSQTGCLKLVLNLPGGSKAVKSVTFEGEGIQTLSLTVENGALSNNSFTAYLPCGEIRLDSSKKVTITVLTEGDESLVNSFYPGTQTLHESHIIVLNTSDEKWSRTLNGKGSEKDPYTISNLEELNNIRNCIAANSFTYFKMTADIDMSGVKDWKPFNQVNEGYGIMLDGNGHKIKGFSCSDAKWASFIGVLYGTVKNLTFEDPVISTSSSSQCGVVAAWVGNSNGSLNGRLENVHVVRGKVSNSSNAVIGGLSGESGEGTFINCSFDGTVERTGTSASDYVPAGGMLGRAQMGVNFNGCSTSGSLTTASGRACGGLLGQCSTTINFKNCTSTMNISARDDVAGGIVGYYGNGTISGCHVESDITVREKGSGSSYVGGIAGHTAGAVIITDCTYKGTLDAFSGIVGGILGQCNTSSGNGCTMSRCFSEGTIKATTVVGGLLGRATDYGLNITDCGSTMDIKCTSSYVGGLIGDLPKNATVRNCFATGSVEGSFALGGIAGRAFGRQGSSVSLDVDVKTTVEGCIAFNPSIRTVTSGGESPTSHYSGGAVIGCSSRPNTLKNCWRNPAMVFDFYSNASLNILFDHEDSSPSAPLVQPAGAEKWFSPYHGKAAAAGTTLSSVAKAAGWSAEVWDLSGDIPKLK